MEEPGIKQKAYYQGWHKNPKPGRTSYGLRRRSAPFFALEKYLPINLTQPNTLEDTQMHQSTMLPQSSFEGVSKKLKYRLSPIFTLVTFLTMPLLLWSIYGNWLMRVTPAPYDALWRLLGPLYLLTDFLNPVYSNPVQFFSLCFGCGLLVVITLLGGRLNWIIKNCFIVGGGFILVAPLMVLVMYAPYQPYAKPAAGHDMQWLTQPSNGFDSAFKSAQRVHEKYGTTYILYGWSSDNVLYYGSDHGSTLWQYDPAYQDNPLQIEAVPAEVIQNAIVEKMKRNIYPSHPSQLSPDTIDYIITYEKSVSPDGKWVSAAIKNYYGPRDVIVLTR